MVLRALLALALTTASPAQAAQETPADPTADFVVRLEQAAAGGDTAAILALAVSPDAVGVRDFAGSLGTRPSRLVVKERDRAPLLAGGDRVLLEIFAEYGREGIVSTWRVDLAPAAEPAAPRRIASMEQLTVVSGLYRLELNRSKQFDVRNLSVQGTDLTLELPSGQAFVADIQDGTTAVVLLGRGRMRFAPSDRAERTQVRIFSGDEVLSTDFEAAFLRVRPSDFARLFAPGSLVPKAVAQGDLRRASDVFDGHISQTLQLDLMDLSRDRWSLIPTPGDLIAEVRTRRFGNLTYARSLKDAEDISLFDRRRRRNIAVYASEQKLASRGRFYSEDDLVEYDVQAYDIDASFTPDRLWVDGNARIRLRIRAYALTALNLKLAEQLTVRSVTAADYGRLLHFRVVGQNAVIVNFPKAVPRDTEVSLNVVYGGRLEPQPIDRESVAVAQQQQDLQELYIPIEPSYIYSNRSYWYPQATVTDYATARMRLTVPASLDVIATGSAVGAPTPAPPSPLSGEQARTQFVFEADSPVRYLACVISRFSPVHSRSLPVTPAARARTTREDTAAGPAEDGTQERPLSAAHAPDTPGVALHLQATPRQVGRARSLADRTAGILEYYARLMGDAPYPSFTLALTESDLPGGHSPAYFAMLNQPHPMLPVVWRNDPVAFDGYPPYFLAHEVAHQWWGQAVGWKNYHEQWLSEGFSQYFAVLYAASDRGDDTLTDMLRQMRRWAVEQSSQGPVYLGYRLGHIRNDGRIFRAVVYNKGAMVLHMLRRLVGDAEFFAGVRQFYQEWKFRKAGTNDFRLVMERATGQDLSAFFDAWIYDSDVPSLKLTTVVSGSDVQLRLEHRGRVMPVPVTVSIVYTDGRIDDVVIPVIERVAERTVPVRGTVRTIDANRDHAAVAEFSR